MSKHLSEPLGFQAHGHKASGTDSMEQGEHVAPGNEAPRNGCVFFLDYHGHFWYVTWHVIWLLICHHWDFKRSPFCLEIFSDVFFHMFLSHFWRFASLRWKSPSRPRGRRRLSRFGPSSLGMVKTQTEMKGFWITGLKKTKNNNITLIYTVCSTNIILRDFFKLTHSLIDHLTG